MPEPRIQYQSISIHPTQVNVFHNLTGTKLTPLPRTTKPPQFENNDHRGIISKQAAKKISRSIDYLIYLSKPKKLPRSKAGQGKWFKLSFITLTLSSEQIHTDNEIKAALLHHFLVELETRFSVKNYVWRAEKQKNGNIHFHIITDKFIYWNDIRNTWNRIQQKLGYVTRYRENRINWHKDGFKFDPYLSRFWPLERQRKAYEQGIRSNWENPNSRDVHAIKKIKKLAGYFKKYMTKSQDPTQVEGRLWGCSQSLSKITGGRADLYSAVQDELTRLMSHKVVRVINEDWYTVIFIDIDFLRLNHFPLLCHIFDTFILERFSLPPPNPLF
jgi:hypothetical protein